MTNREIMLQNFIASRGEKSLRKIISMFQEQISGEVIAKEFGVTRERVRQWRDAFGTTVQVYFVYPSIEKICKGKPED